MAETRVALGRDELARRRRSVAGARCRVAAKLRSAQPPVAATLHRADAGEAELVLDEPAGAVAPGQAAVLYDGERVLGGGWIRPPRQCVHRGVRRASLTDSGPSPISGPRGGVAQLVRAGES